MKLGLFAVLLWSSTPTASAGSTYLIFGSKLSGWIAVDPKTHRVEALHFPAPFKPEAIAISRHGTELVFTAFHPPARNVLLFRWQRNSSGSPVSIGDDRGYHSDPSLSEDGQWVYFAHNPLAFGPPGQHQGQAYAQLYRVRLDGTQLMPLTEESGCHFGPTNATGEQLIYLYSTCSGDRVLRRLDLKKLISIDLHKAGWAFNEASASPDSRAVLISIGGFDSVSIAEVDLRSLQMRTVLRIAGASPPVRPRYGAQRNEIFYQARGAVWVSQGNSTNQIAQL